MSVTRGVFHVAVLAGAIALLSLPADAQNIVGWRGDGMGCYPDATPPLEWSRTSKGIARTLLTQTQRPADDSTADAKPMRDGVIRQWLAVGPFDAGDPATALDREQVPNEAQLQPADDGKLGDMAWKPVRVVGDKDEANQYNTVALNWVNLKACLGLEANQIGYAHAYVYAAQAGKVKAIVDHVEGMKVRVNGKPVYSEPKGRAVYGAGNNDVYWLEHFIPVPRSAVFEIDLDRGWNRLLFKCVRQKNDCQFDVRFVDAEPIAYETKNILWTTRLPGFANAMPVIVGDRIFVTSEPDELVCLNKQDGKILWKTFYGHYDSLTDEDRKAHPVIAEKIDPLVKQLRETEDPDQKMAIRKQVRDLLMSIDKEKYALQTVKHLPIVGYCTPTPVSDGKFVYVISGNGVAACFDLDGKPQWIRHAHQQFKGRPGGWAHHGYPGSPVLVDGKFIFHLSYLVALDAKTGAELWRADTDGGNPAPDVINGSLWATTVGGTPVVMTAKGLFYNANDGKLLWDAPSKPRYADGYAPQGASVALLRIGNLVVVQMPASVKEDLKMDVREIRGGHPGGMLLASPLYCEDLFYAVDMNGVLDVTDAKTGNVIYTKKLDLEPYIFWNGTGVCASLALGGKYIYVMDNRGHTIVFRPGREFVQVVRNTIEDNLPRRIPDDPQELTQSTPAFDGARIYIRGEDNLYCIGEK